MDCEGEEELDGAMQGFGRRLELPHTRGGSRSTTGAARASAKPCCPALALHLWYCVSDGTWCVVASGPQTVPILLTFLQDTVLAKGRLLLESLSTMRSSSW